MKHKIKGILVAALMAVMVFCLAACGSNATRDQIDSDTSANLVSIATQTVTSILKMDDATLQGTISQERASKQITVADGLQSWLDQKPEMGDFVSIDSTKVQEADSGYIVSLGITCTNRTGHVIFGVDKNFSAINLLTVNKTETLPEKLESAGMNLLVGMVVVFFVLFLMAWIISLLKYVGKGASGKKKSGGEEIPSAGDGVSAAPAIPSEIETETVDDGELIAVITAAIAASQEACSDGLIVRSIRRVKNSRW